MNNNNNEEYYSIPYSIILYIVLYVVPDPVQQVRAGAHVVERARADGQGHLRLIHRAEPQS